MTGRADAGRDGRTRLARPNFVKVKNTARFSQSDANRDRKTNFPCSADSKEFYMAIDDWSAVCT